MPGRFPGWLPPLPLPSLPLPSLSLPSLSLRGDFCTLERDFLVENRHATGWGNAAGNGVGQRGWAPEDEASSPGTRGQLPRDTRPAPPGHEASSGAQKSGPSRERVGPLL
ncbi:hypothetical protein GCM10009595_18630 [Falsarthrobacter nasiphocae]